MLFNKKIIIFYCIKTSFLTYKQLLILPYSIDSFDFYMFINIKIMFIDFNKIHFLIKPINIIQEINSLLLLYISSLKIKLCYNM